MWVFSPAFVLLIIVQIVIVVQAGVPDAGKLPRLFFNTEANSGGQQGQGQIHCPCSFLGCSVGIVSTSNSHKVTCNGNTYTLSCENPLMGSVGRLFILQTISHPLDETKTYQLTDQSVWKCSTEETDPVQDPTPDPTPEPVTVGCTECADFNGRIVGGNEVTPNKYPFMVMLMVDTADIDVPSSDTRYLPICAGTIVNKRYILSAAQCLFSYKSVKDAVMAAGLNTTEAGPKLVVSVGDHDICDDSTGQKLIPATIETVHPNYWYTLESVTPHDLWVIKLEEDLVWSDTVKPVCLPQPEIDMDMTLSSLGYGYGVSEYSADHYNGFVTSFKDMSGTIIGWGSTEKWEVTDPFPETVAANCILKEAGMKIMDKDDPVCLENTVGWENQKAMTNMCAQSDPIGTAGTCFYDAGAPLIVNDNGKALQVGITSYGAGCASSTGAPDVFTRVSNYLGFIGMSTSDGTC